MLQDFIVPFMAVGLAELGDKTQLAVLCLAGKTKQYFQLIFGVMLAFILTDGLAVVFGDFISKNIPVNYIKIISGVVFILFGIISIINSKEEEAKCELKKPFVSGFSLVFFAEMGDKTQIASALFATKYNPLIVFISIISVLGLLSVLACALGKYILAKVNRKLISRISGLLYIIIGVLFFF